MKFYNDHFLSVEQLDPNSIQSLFILADKMKKYTDRQLTSKVLDGAILCSLFFEPSTRTRLSFGSAFNLLGGSVRETVGSGASSLSKGESLFDTAKVVSHYSDVITMRHPDKYSVNKFSKGSTVPVINAGDGANEHPTQALLDLYTIHKELKTKKKLINNAHIVFIGDLKHSRTIHSLCKLLTHYKGLNITFVSPDALTMPLQALDELYDSGVIINQTYHLEQSFNCDVIYQTRIQEERFNSQEDANKYRGIYRLNQSVYQSSFGNSGIIMHPLPRDSRPQANELDTDLYPLEHESKKSNLRIFEQSNNGLAIRMALFIKILDVESSLGSNDQPVIWKTNR